MIPKIIHYCWFGPNEIPERYRNYIRRWQEKMPGFTFIKWDETNSPMELPYIKKAVSHGKWTNISNYVRLHAIYEYGGIYMDVDVEVVKQLDPLLNNSSFFGFQLPNAFNVNNAIFGASKGHRFIRKFKEDLLQLYDGIETEYLSSPHLTTYLLSNRKTLNRENRFDDGDVKIYPFDYFYPYSWLQTFNETCITSNTFTVHHWSGTWVPKPTVYSEKQSLKNRIKSKIRSWI